jgi:hypothetical protein
MQPNIPTQASTHKDIGNLDRAAAERRRAAWALPMNERLAKVHRLCKQASAIKGVARVH